jgi:hypothetical protein
MNSYKWLRTNILLRRDADGATIPWPPVESEGFKAKIEITAGAIVAPEDPPVPAIDFSDVNNVERGLKALALTFAQITNTPIATVRTIFKQKWDSLG